MQSTIQYIKQELNEFYPDSEVSGFIRLILENVCNIDYSGRFLHNNIKICDGDKEKIFKIVRRLKNFEPIQYILGETGFYNLTLNVKQGVFIPRPETEELAAWIIESNNLADPEILDIGTGSGCIALTLKKNIEKSRVSAVEIMEDTILVARENAEKNKLDINFILADILDSDNCKWGRYDIIVSNPPYVMDMEKSVMQPNVLNYEPEVALFVPDDDPLKYYIAITGFAQKFLREEGWIYFEINGKLGDETVNLLREKGFRNLELKRDLSGKDRMVRGQKRV